MLCLYHTHPVSEEMICLGVAAPLPTNTLVAELVHEKCLFAVVISFCVWEKCTAGACVASSTGHPRVCGWW